MIFPDEEWKTTTPAESEWDSKMGSSIDALMKRGEANGVLVRGGHVVAQWDHGGPLDQPFETQSVTKSFTSIVLGLSLDDALIPSLDTPVKEMFPAFDAGPHTNEITFRHLATMTSGIKPSRWTADAQELTAPDIQMNYHADQCAHLVRALTYVNDRSLFDIIKERILEPIGANGSWREDSEPWSPVTTRSGKKVPVNAGYAFFTINAPDLARVGHLFLNRGQWKKQQLISEDYVQQSWTECPLKPMRETHRGEGYGLYWWRLIPGVWAMNGQGGQFCMVWPEHEIVMTKVNRFANTAASLRDLFPLVYRLVTGLEFVTPKAWG